MKKMVVKKYLRLASIIVFSMMVGSVITIFIKEDSGYIRKNITKIDKEYSEFESLYEAYNTIINEYYNEVDSKKLIDGAKSGMLNALEDQHTSYFDKEETESFDTELAGTYYGIGAQIQLIEENKVQIIKIFDGSPAEKAGLKVGDIFVSIDGKSTDGLDANDVASILKSDKVKKSTLIMNRDGKEVEVKVIKANVTLFSVSSEMIDENDKIGYISVSLFSKNTYSQFKTAVEKLEKENINSLIIDLRGNTGGYLSTVTNMLELFIDKDKVLYQIQTNNGTTEYTSKFNNNRDYKVVILIDGGSASASEIMAAAMKENYGAILVGKTTYGKGTVQTTKKLSDGTMIKYTIEKWLTPNGNNIDGEGIKPDYDIDLSEEYNNNPTNENDTQLQKALELLK
ncbi:MAG: S41 family peptidase [Bacilli bacterium]|nr:S41 family peptidase [Bacilli bacterium]